MGKLLVLLGMLASFAAQAQHQHGAHSAYAGFESRGIKALSPQQVADLLEGRGMGASLPAELNGAPGPMHVLQLKEALDLTPQQAARLEQLTSAMKASAQQLGRRLVEEERRLDQGFKQGTADESFVNATAARIAVLQGELRAVHLVAHLKTKQLLSAKQVLAYNEARGYGPVPHH